MSMDFAGKFTYKLKHCRKADSQTEKKMAKKATKSSKKPAKKGK
jgi:hypothetical protein